MTPTPIGSVLPSYSFTPQASYGNPSFPAGPLAGMPRGRMGAPAGQVSAMGSGPNTLAAISRPTLRIPPAQPTPRFTATPAYSGPSDAYIRSTLTRGMPEAYAAGQQQVQAQRGRINQYRQQAQNFYNSGNSQLYDASSPYSQGYAAAPRSPGVDQQYLNSLGLRSRFQRDRSYLTQNSGMPELPAGQGITDFVGASRRAALNAARGPVSAVGPEAGRSFTRTVGPDGRVSVVGQQLVGSDSPRAQAIANRGGSMISAPYSYRPQTAPRYGVSARRRARLANNAARSIYG